MASSIINSDDGSVSGTTGLKTTGGDDGELAFESSGTEAMRIDSSGRVGIGTSSPAEALHITTASSSTTAVTGLKIQNSADLNGENVGISFGSTSWPDGGAIYAEDQSNDGLVDICFALRPSGGGNPTERMRIDSSGRVTMPYQPAFMAQKGAGTVSAGNPYIFDVVSFNTGNHYNSSTGVFTAPITGVYHFDVIMLLHNNNASNEYYWRALLNGSTTVVDCYSMASVANHHYIYPSSFTIKMTANDYIQIRIQSGIFYGGTSNTLFSGFLVG